MATAPVTRNVLLQTAEQQWRQSEEALRESAGRFDDRLEGSDWTVGDVFRHITDASARVLPIIEALRTEGRVDDFRPDELNPAGIARLSGRSPRELASDLERAHQQLRATLEGLTDGDLRRPVTFVGTETTLGDLLTRALLGHEGGHVADALGGEARRESYDASRRG